MNPKKIRKKIEGILGTQQAQEFRALNVQAFDEGIGDIMQQLFEN